MKNCTSLRNFLHYKFLANGEIGTIADSAKDIAEWIIDNEVDYSDSKVLSIWRQAGEDFIDSMQANIEESDYDDLAKYESEYARLEAMRPRVILEKRIASIKDTSV